MASARHTSAAAWICGGALVCWALSGLAQPLDRIGRLGRLLQTASSEKVRLRVVLTLGKLRDRRAVPALTTALADRSHWVRGLAAAALGQIGDPRALPELREAARRDGHPFVRRKAERAVKRLAALEARKAPSPAPTPPAPSKPRPVYLTVGKLHNKAGTGGPRMAQLLEQALREEFGRVPGVKSGSPTTEEIQREGVKAFTLSGAILKLSRKRAGLGLALSCRLRVSLATYPENSMKAFYSGEASMEVPSLGGGPQALDSVYREFFGGAAREAREHIVRSYLSLQ